MKCNDIRELLSLYIDLMLEEDQAKEVEEHISNCDSCRKEYEELKEMIGLLNQTEMVPVPEAFNFRLKKALKEEKQNMIESKILEKKSKKNHRLRMFTSIAAVFAVGVISFGLYHDVLDFLPGKLNGTEQTETAEPEAVLDDQKSEYAMKSAELEKDDSVMMKDDLYGAMPEEASLSGAAQEYTSSANTDQNQAKEKASSAPDSSEMQTYGLAEAPDADGGQGTEDLSNSESLTVTEASDEATSSDSKRIPSSEECSRSLTSSGVERNTAAVQYYNNLIEDRLEGFDYQILSSSYAQTRVWKFEIFIFRGKDGNTYNEEILVIGKDGEIQVICSNEFMGLNK